MATPFRPFNNVPNEILLYILSSVDARDHLNVKLVSKIFNSCAVDIDMTTLTLAEAAKCHAAIEASFPRNKALICCCCTHCGLVKDTDQFSDPHATKKKANRTCVACGIRRSKYSNTCLPFVGGEHRIPCYDCLQPMSIYAGWRLKSAEAAVLLRLSSGKIYCQHCLESRLCRRFSTMQQRDQEIRRIHADPAYGYYWQKVECELGFGRCVPVRFVHGAQSLGGVEGIRRG